MKFPARDHKTQRRASIEQPKDAAISEVPGRRVRFPKRQASTSTPTQDRTVRDGGLSAETLAHFEDAHVAAVEPGPLSAALAASVLALMHEGAEARLPFARVVAERLGEFG